MLVGMVTCLEIYFKTLIRVLVSSFSTIGPLTVISKLIPFVPRPKRFGYILMKYVVSIQKVQLLFTHHFSLLPQNGKLYNVKV